MANQTNIGMTGTCNGGSRCIGLAIALLALATGCRENPLVPDGNTRPVANAGADMTLDFTGTPVEVRLDGTGSIDEDGEIVGYRWLSGTAIATDAGPMGRMLPEGEDPGWPEDVARPTVTLPQGVWNFELWVTDDKGAVSAPASVEIRVGADPVMACINGIVDGPTDACKQCVCSIDDMCRAAVVESACGADCWGLISCIGAMCPDFAAMSAAGDFSCVTTNCADFLSGATPARAAGMCVTMCPDDCTAM